MDLKNLALAITAAALAFGTIFAVGMITLALAQNPPGGSGQPALIVPEECPERYGLLRVEMYMGAGDYDIVTFDCARLVESDDYAPRIRMKRRLREFIDWLLA